MSANADREHPEAINDNRDGCPVQSFSWTNVSITKQNNRFFYVSANVPIIVEGAESIMSVSDLKLPITIIDGFKQLCRLSS